MSRLYLSLAVLVLVFCTCEVRAKLKDGDCEGIYLSQCSQLQYKLNFLAVIPYQFKTASQKLNIVLFSVCIQFLSKFERQLKENDVGSNVNKIEIELMKACKSAKGKDERFVSIWPSNIDTGLYFITTPPILFHNWIHTTYHIWPLVSGPFLFSGKWSSALLCLD